MILDLPIIYIYPSKLEIILIGYINYTCLAPILNAKADQPIRNLYDI